MQPATPYLDLKLELGLLERRARTRLLEDVAQDGFTHVCLSQTVNVDQGATRTDYEPLPSSVKLKVFQRLNIRVFENAQVKQIKARAERTDGFDLVSVEFATPEVLEFFLQNNNELGDNLLYFDLRSFVPAPPVLKQLKGTCFFLEFGYADVLDPATRKQALIGLYKLLDCMNKRILMSSNAHSVFECRAVEDLRDFLAGITENSQAKGTSLLRRLVQENPTDVLKRAKLRREGLVSELK